MQISKEWLHAEEKKVEIISCACLICIAGFKIVFDLWSIVSHLQCVLLINPLILAIFFKKARSSEAFFQIQSNEKFKIIPFDP